MQRLLGMSTLLMLSASALAQPAPPVEFKGFRVGDNNYPQFQSDRRFDCKTITEPIADHVCSASNDTIAGAKAISSLFLFYGDRLETILVTFSAKDFQQVKRALRDKYGSGDIKSSTVQNRMGVQFDNETATWRSGGTSIILKMRDQTLDRGSVIFKADGAEDEYSRRARAADRKNANDL